MSNVRPTGKKPPAASAKPLQTSMDKLADWNETVSILDAYLKPIAQRPVDIGDPEWFTKLTGGSHPLDEAGLRSQTESLLAEIIEYYLRGDDAARQAIREIFEKNHSFSWAATLHFPPTTPEDFRSHLILLAIKDQGLDSRDAILSLQDLCERASYAGVDTVPVLRDVAPLCSDENKYGTGSTRSMLLTRAEQENSANAKKRCG